MASFFVVACQNTKVPQDEHEKLEKKVRGNMPKTSELALLMRNLYTTNEMWKKDLNNNVLPNDFPQEYQNMRSAKPTETMVGNKETFNPFAEAYKAQIQLFEKAKTVDQAKILYNNAIGTCISCHQVYCLGPLPKIKRLKLPTE